MKKFSLTAVALVVLSVIMSGCATQQISWEEWGKLPTTKEVNKINVSAICYIDGSKPVPFPSEESKKAAENFTRAVGAGFSKAGYEVSYNYPPVGTACELEKLPRDPGVLTALTVLNIREPLFFGKKDVRIKFLFTREGGKFIGGGRIKNSLEEAEATASGMVEFILGNINRAREMKQIPL